MRSFQEIAERVRSGRAVVMTAQEVCCLLDGRELEEVDIVTTATRAVMSGTYAVLSFPVGRPGSFTRAARAWLNGVPAHVGPCPNERLGMLDLMVFGTDHSRSQPGYGGGHLLRELVEGRAALLEMEAEDGRVVTEDISLEEMPFARLFGTRHAFMNYSAFVNGGGLPVSTIFHACRFQPGLSCATFSGCGQISPLKCDPLLETIGVGTRVLLNGAEGFVIGTGTRSSPERPNLAVFGDMHRMDPEYMGGFRTSAGPECISSLAVPIPVVSRRVLSEIARRDREIPLPVMDVSTRSGIGSADYGDVWDGAEIEVTFEEDLCSGCASCRAEEVCPMQAVHFDGQRAERDEALCFHCGLCSVKCPSGAFRCEMGSLHVETASGRLLIPVVLRQSDRLRALRLAEDLKERILDGSFEVTQPVERIS
ncbi:MAG: methanogenesis marker 16 metalloprotein [Methanothrix sp.]|nr:methanogenesis marker 16 metalloprotein [Methanothrix sp.]